MSAGQRRILTLSSTSQSAERIMLGVGEEYGVRRRLYTPSFMERRSQRNSGGSPGPSSSRAAARGGGRASGNRVLMVLRVVYVLLIVAGTVGLAFGAVQGAWLVVVVAFFWVSQESRYGFLRRR